MVLLNYWIDWRSEQIVICVKTLQTFNYELCKFYIAVFQALENQSARIVNYLVNYIFIKKE